MMKHFVHILDALTTKGFDGSLTDLHRLSFHSKYRATPSYFFTKSLWEEEVLIHKLQSWILRRLEQQPNERTAPLFSSIDAPLCLKTKSSSRAKHAIQGCDWHDSHTEKKFVGGIPLFGSWFIP